MPKELVVLLAIWTLFTAAFGQMGESIKKVRPRADTADAVSMIIPLNSADKTLNSSPSALASTACQSTFTSGSGLKYLSYCVTINGNIIGFTAPQGYRQEFPTEGYGICDFTDTQNPPLSYWDEAGAANFTWLNSTISQPNGANTFPLTITRATSDGNWLLKQTFSQNTTERYVKVNMTVTNNTPITRAVQLMRNMDVDADNSGTNDYFDGDGFATWGHEISQSGHGVALVALPASVVSFQSGTTVASSGAVGACGEIGTLHNVPFAGDGELFHYWIFDLDSGTGIRPGASKTVTFEYRAM